LIAEFACSFCWEFLIQSSPLASSFQIIGAILIAPFKRSETNTQAKYFEVNIQQSTVMQFLCSWFCGT